MMLTSHKKIISMTTTTASLFLIVSVLSIGNIHAQTPPPLEPPPTTSATDTPVEKNNNNNDSTAPESILISGKVTIPITSTTQIIIDLPIKSDSKIEIVPIK